MGEFLLRFFKSCAKHDIFNLAANISFFAILALLPLFMIFFSITGYLLGSEAAVKEIVSEFADTIPGAGNVILSNLRNVISMRSSLGIFGILFLLITSTLIFASIERAFGVIFESGKRHFLKSRAISILVICIILLFFFIPPLVTFLEKTLANYGVILTISRYFSGKLFSFLLCLFSITTIIMLIANVKLSFRHALLGGAFFTGAAFVVKFVYYAYLGMAMKRYNLLYGSLSVFVLTTIWIYYLSVILMMAAELVANLARQKT